jgi:1,2-dihydroxy-3-keto-5-methylthiopentene dioxygenase
MSVLAIYNDSDSSLLETHRDYEAIADALNGIGVKFERWQADRELPYGASNEDVLKAYDSDVKRLMDEYGFKSADVISLHPDHPDKVALRQKFLDEHTHSDFEVRFFVDGKGLFYIHADNKVYAMLCEKNDLISVPANTTHWFDMGINPSFRCVRLFSTPEGWVAQMTGSDIARRFPDFDDFVGAHA